MMRSKHWIPSQSARARSHDNPPMAPMDSVGMGERPPIGTRHGGLTMAPVTHTNSSEDSVTANYASLFARTVALTAAFATTALAQTQAPRSADPRPGQTAPVGRDSGSSGWIDFTPYTNFGIYVPVRINGHEAMALLYGGPSSIDKTFAASIGLQADSSAAVAGANVVVGGLTLRNVNAKTDDLRAQGYDARILGRPVLFRLGEEVFGRVAVDIDFPHHRVAFRDVRTVSKPGRRSKCR